LPSKIVHGRTDSLCCHVVFVVGENIAFNKVEGYIVSKETEGKAAGGRHSQRLTAVIIYNSNI
jgi:hypothetical protein